MNAAARRFPIVEAIVAAVALVAVSIAATISARQAQSGLNGYDTRSTYDVTSGGYRAWYELLQREGVDVQRFERRPAYLDGSVDVYVTAVDLNAVAAQAAAGGDVNLFVDADWEALAKWVRAGGHLVWLADGKLTPNYLNTPDVEGSGLKTDNAVTVALSPLTVGVHSVSGTSPLRVPFKNALRTAPLVADDTGAVVTEYPLGKGSVTVVSDESLFDNDRLSHADNARLAYDLATTGLTPRASIAFDEWSHGHVTGDNWWSVLPRPLQLALVAIALVLVALAVGTALRFGPVAPVADESERTSAEYLTSMAVLYQRGRAVRAALVEMADACLRDVSQALGLPEGASARAIALRAGSGASDERSEAVMELDRLRSYEFPHDADLVRAAAISTLLRKEFTRHGRTGIGRRFTPQRRTA